MLGGGGGGNDGSLAWNPGFPQLLPFLSTCLPTFLPTPSGPTYLSPSLPTSLPHLVLTYLSPSLLPTSLPTYPPSLLPTFLPTPSGPYLPLAFPHLSTSFSFLTYLPPASLTSWARIIHTEKMDTTDFDLTLLFVVHTGSHRLRLVCRYSGLIISLVVNEMLPRGNCLRPASGKRLIFKCWYSQLSLSGHSLKRTVALVPRVSALEIVDCTPVCHQENGLRLRVFVSGSSRSFMRDNLYKR